MYRQLGDMRGLLDEVAGFGFLAYLGEKTARESVGDPVEQLRSGYSLVPGERILLAEWLDGRRS